MLSLLAFFIIVGVVAYVAAIVTVFIIIIGICFNYCSFCSYCCYYCNCCSVVIVTVSVTNDLVCFLLLLFFINNVVVFVVVVKTTSHKYVYASSIPNAHFSYTTNSNSKHNNSSIKYCQQPTQHCVVAKAQKFACYQFIARWPLAFRSYCYFVLTTLPYILALCGYG